MVLRNIETGESLKGNDLEQLRAYRVPAGLVHTHLLDLMVNGERTFGPTSHGAPAPIRKMLLVGGRYAPPLGGKLDSAGSTPQDLTLASELQTIVRQVVGDQGDLDMQKWSTRALHAIDAAERGKPVDALGAERGFVERELLPVLERIVDLPPTAELE